MHLHHARHANRRAAARTSAPPTGASAARSRTRRSSPARWSTGSRRRRRSTIKKHTNGVDADSRAGAVHPGRLNGHLDLPRDQHRQRAAHRRHRHRQPDQRDRLLPRTTSLPGETMTCTATGTAARASTRTRDGHRHGRAGRRSPTPIRRTTSAWPPGSTSRRPPTVDADLPPGPVHPGRRRGHLDVRRHQHRQRRRSTDVTVTDSVIGVVVTCPRRSTRSTSAEIVTCTAPAATAVAGQYENVGSVTGTGPTGSRCRTRTRRTTSARTRRSPSRSRRTLDPADTPPGPLLAVGEPRHLAVRDHQHRQRAADRLVADRRPGAPPSRVRCLFLLVPARRSPASSTRTVQAGQYATSAPSRFGPGGTGTRHRPDPSHYFGVAGRHRHREVHERRGRRRGPGPFIPVGGLGHLDLRGHQHRQQPADRRRGRRSRAPSPSRCPATTLAAGCIDDVHGDRDCRARPVHELRGRDRRDATRPARARCRPVALLRRGTRGSSSRSPPTASTPTRRPGRSSRSAIRSTGPTSSPTPATWR